MILHFNAKMKLQYEITYYWEIFQSRGTIPQKVLLSAPLFTHELPHTVSVAFNWTLSSPSGDWSALKQCFEHCLVRHTQQPIMLWKTLSSILQMTSHCIVQSTHPKDKQIAAALLPADLELIQFWSDKWNLFFNPAKSCSLTWSFQKGHKTNPPIYFDGHSLEEVQSLDMM